MLNQNLKYEISLISNVHIFFIVISLILLIIFFVRLKRDFALYSFMAVQLSLIFWMFFKILKTVAPNEVLRWIFIVAYYFFIFVFEVAIFNFTYSLYKNKKPRRNENIALFILAFFQFMVVATNPLHMKFYSEYTMWDDSFGPMFYINQGIVYFIIAVSSYYGIMNFRAKLRFASRLYKRFMASIILVPVITNILFVSKTLHRLLDLIGFHIHFDITPMAFIFSVFIFYYVTFDKDLLEVSPILRHEIVNNLDTAIYFLDSSLRVSYNNQKSIDLLGVSGTDIIESEVKTLKIGDNSMAEKELEFGGKDLILRAFRVDAIIETQYLITLDDISEYRKMREKIAYQNDKLEKINAELKIAIKQLQKASKVGARNFVAKELHDIIGHSLVVVIKLMEVAKMYFKNDKNLCKISLDDSILALNDGIEDMANIREHEERYNTNMLQEEIRKMLDRMKSSNIKTHFNFKGSRVELSSEVYDVLIRVCSELVTNSIKHAEPSAIFIALKVRKNKILISVIDNGKGCYELVEGNGLKGIRERLGIINGNIDFICGEGEGFMSKLELVI